MKNYIQPGGTITLTAPYDVVAGACALVGTLFGVAGNSYLSGALGEFCTEGVFSLAKVSAQAWSAGDAIYWDNSAKLCTTVATGNTPIGRCIEAAANPSATGKVLLNEGQVASVGGIGATATSAIATDGTNATLLTITLKDAAGNALAAPTNFDIWLSDAATGAGLTAVTASGAVNVKAGGGADIGTLTTKKALRSQTKADGTYQLSITDSAKTQFYPCVSIGGRTVVLSQILTANYG